MRTIDEIIDDESRKLYSDDLPIGGLTSRFATCVIKEAMEEMRRECAKEVQAVVDTLHDCGGGLVTSHEPSCIRFTTEFQDRIDNICIR